MAAEIPDGAVLIARAIFNSSLWTMRDQDRILAITLIGIANWQDRKWFDGEREIVIKRGELVRSLDDLAEAARLSVQKVRTSLSHLEKTGFLTRKPTRRYTHITLCKYDFYQNMSNYSDTVSNRQLTRDQHDTNTTLTDVQHDPNNKQEGEEREEGKNGRPMPSSPLGLLLTKAKDNGIPGREDTLLSYLRAWVKRSDYTKAEQIVTDPWSAGKTVIEMQNHWFPKDAEGVENFRSKRDAFPKF